jgi:hypothetical protein
MTAGATSASRLAIEELLANVPPEETPDVSGAWGLPRRQDLFRDAEDRECFVEVCTVANWLEHMREVAAVRWARRHFPHGSHWTHQPGASPSRASSTT